MADTDHPDAGDIDHESIVEGFFDTLDAPEESETASEPSAEAETGEPTAEADSDPEEAPEVDEDEGDENEDEDPVEEPADPKDDETLVDWEKRFKDQQSFHDRQMAQMQRNLEELQAWAQNAYQQQMMQHQQSLQMQQAQNPYANIDKETLTKQVETDLVSTFRGVAQYRPELVPTTIALAREKYGNEVGDQMMFEYNEYRRAQDQQAMIAQQQAAYEAQMQAEAPAQIQEVMTDIITSVADQYGEAFDAVRPEFVQRVQETAPLYKQYMDEQGYEMTPVAVRQFLVDTFQQLREQKLNEQASKPRRPRKIAASEHVETSTPGNGGDEQSADDLAISELLQGAKELSIDTNVPNR